jgi:hypothetical protein
VSCFALIKGNTAVNEKWRSTLMANYHFHAQIIKGSVGRSAVAAAAYRAGEKLHDEKQDVDHDYSRKTGVVWREIYLPDNAPEEFYDRETLWNAVEKAETDPKGRFAREINLALPRELDGEDQFGILVNFIYANFKDRGIIADMAIHDKGDGNPHAHIMLPMRPMNERGEWENKTQKVYICKNAEGKERGFTAEELKAQPAGVWAKKLPYYKNGDVNGERLYLTKAEAKTNPAYKDYQHVKGKNDPQKTFADRENPVYAEWNKTETLINWRLQWARECNDMLRDQNIKALVDHRSFKDRGIIQLPTVHRGAAANELEKRGIKTDVGSYNREIKSLNNEVKRMSQQQINNSRDLETELQEIRQMLLKTQANQEQAEREQTAAKEQATKEQAAKEQAQREADRLKAEQEHAALSRDTRERDGREPPQAKTHSLDYKPKIEDEGQTALPPQQPADQVIKQANALQKSYFKLENYQIASAKVERRSQTEVRETRAIINELQRSQDRIGGLDREITDLQSERGNLGIFHGKDKKRLDGQIERAQKQRQEAEAHLEDNYGIKPEEIGGLIQKLTAKMNKEQKDYDELIKVRKAKLDDPQEAIKKQFSELITSLENRPDKEKIYEAIKGIKDNTQTEDQAVAFHNLKVNLHSMIKTGPTLNISHDHIFTR